MKKILIVVCMACTAAVVFTGCNKNNGDAIVINGATYTNRDTLMGTLVLPTRIDSVFSGSVAGWYDSTANVFTYTVAWYNLWKTMSVDTLSQIKFYGAATATDSGKLVRTVVLASYIPTSILTLASLSGGGALSAAETKDFLNGNWYMVLCTKKYPNGIVRGKLNPARR